MPAAVRGALAPASTPTAAVAVATGTKPAAGTFQFDLGRGMATKCPGIKVLPPPARVVTQMAPSYLSSESARFPI